MSETIAEGVLRMNAAVTGRVSFAAVLDTRCRAHQARAGEPCWTLTSERGTFRALCDARVKVAGYRGKARPSSRPSRPDRVGAHA